jgi:glycosyltransferase involved in cell wall biosynthesis
MLKLIIQIPCYNEVDTLSAVLADLPREIEGVDEIRTLVVDDGSTDGTADEARRLGVDYIVRNGGNLGLARTFSRGLEACLTLGADIIVNTDGDNQYRGRDIPRLVEPILENRADMVIGCRDIAGHREFSPLKRFLQRMGSRLVRRLSRTDIADTTSGFRAINRSAAVEASVMTRFSYTLETLIQAGRTGLRVTSVPIGVNAKTRESRLFTSMGGFIARQLVTILKVYVFYCPMRLFAWLAGAFFFVSLLLGARIAYYLWLAEAPAKVKAGSTALLLFMSISTVIFLVTGLLGSVLGGLRFLLNDLRVRIRSMELERVTRPVDLDVETSPEPGAWRKTPRAGEPREEERE